MSINLKGGVAGRYLIEAVCADGARRTVADWFDNLITDAGLNLLGTSGAFDRCHVGSGTTTPAPTDTAMVTPVATALTIETELHGVQSSVPYFGWHRTTWRFNPGEADGALSELGVGTATGLFSRALIKDGAGSPVAITILPEEYLDITYECRLYPPLDDVLLTIDIGGTSHDVILRACDVTGTPWQPSTLAANGAVGLLSATCFNGTIGDIDENPIGLSGVPSSIIQRAYVSASHSTTFELHFGLDNGNVAGGILSLRFGQQSLGTFQAEFDPVIPKDNTKTLMLPVTIAWARKV